MGVRGCTVNRRTGRSRYNVLAERCCTYNRPSCSSHRLYTWDILQPRTDVGARHTVVAGCSNVYSSRGASATVVHDVLPGARTFLGLMVAERSCALPPSLSVASLRCSDTSALVVVCGRKLSFYTHSILHNTPYTPTLTSFTYFRSFCCFRSSVIVGNVYPSESLRRLKATLKATQSV